MNLLHYEFVAGPDGSINGMLRRLVTDLRYNRSMVTVDVFKSSLPALREIEQQVQNLDREIGRSHRNYIDEILLELDEESESESNIEEDLRRATIATIDSIIGEEIDFEKLSYSTGKAEHYHWIRFSGYTDQRAIDSGILIARETFRAICNKYNYIFIDLS